MPVPPLVSLPLPFANETFNTRVVFNPKALILIVVDVSRSPNGNALPAARLFHLPPANPILQP
jgi:hypothetical protein